MTGGVTLNRDNGPVASSILKPVAASPGDTADISPPLDRPKSCRRQVTPSGPQIGRGLNMLMTPPSIHRLSNN